MALSAADTFTVEQLIEALRQRPPTDKVYGWLPGSRLTLANVFVTRDGETKIELNVEEGSALDRIVRD